MIDDRELTQSTSGPLAAALSGLARAAVGSRDPDRVLRDLAVQGRAVLGVAGAAACRHERGTVRFIASIDAAMSPLEQSQERDGCGPALDACRTAQAVVIADLRAGPTRWPSFEEAAAEAGILGVASVPLRLEGAAIGALDLYRSEARGWSTDDLWAAQLLADMAAGYVVNASELDHQRRLTEQLQRALDSRIIIEQAKGIVSVDRGVSVDAAFDLLRRHARNNGANLQDVADAVVHLNFRP